MIFLYILMYFNLYKYIFYAHGAGFFSAKCEPGPELGWFSFGVLVGFGVSTHQFRGVLNAVFGV